MSIIDQKELDKLLNTVADEAADSKKPDNNSETNEGKINGKIYRKAKETGRKFSFAFAYVSPVIKQENMIYNPESSEETDNDKIVVRSLKNYTEYIRNTK